MWTEAGGLCCLTVLSMCFLVGGDTPSNAAGDLEVVLDVDTGGDDAMAMLIMLSEYSKAKVLAITVVRGNTGVVNATKNTLLVLQVAKRTEVPVYYGSDYGIAFKEDFDYNYGYDALGDTFENKPSTELARDEHAAVALAKIIKERPGKVTLICLGPLTNLALAIHLNKNFLKQVKDVYILGGSYKGGGNVKPGVEFNIYADPEAAAFVFTQAGIEGVEIKVLPIDTVRSAGISLRWRLKTLGGLPSCFMKFSNRAESVSLSKTDDVWEPFDQTTVALVLEPQVIKGTLPSYIIVETCGIHGRGAFFRDHRSNITNSRIITSVDKGLLKEVFIHYLNTTSGNCNF